MAEKKREYFYEYKLYDILKHYCTKDEEILIEPSIKSLETFSMKMRPDLYLPNGCKALRLPKKTILEIRSWVNFDAIQSLRIIHDYFYQVMQTNGYHFVCIFMQERKMPYQPYFEKLPNRINSDFQIKTIDEFLEQAKNDRRVQNIKEQDRSSLVVDMAKSAIQSDFCSFIMGAGVSIDSNLPKWEDLLKRLIDIAKNKNSLELESNDYDQIFNDCGCSNIILGRLVHTLFNDNDHDFVDAIRQALYQGKKVLPGSLATAICKLIRYKYNNRLLLNVITYNYDDLIEKGLKNEGLPSIPVYGNQNRSQYTPIYHVHGFLPQEQNPSSPIVLSEREYHDIYKTSYHWSNVEQLHAMQRSTCFFIGLSMTDPNLRRLLDMSYDDQPKNYNHSIRHYAFLRRGDVARDLQGKKAKEFQSKMEDMLAGLGVAVIWYDKHNELPSKLMEMLNP